MTDEKLIDDGQISPDDVRALARRLFAMYPTIETHVARERIDGSISTHYPPQFAALISYAVKRLVSEVARSIETPGGHRALYVVRDDEGKRNYTQLSFLTRDGLRSLREEYLDRSAQNAGVAAYLARVDDAMGDAPLDARVGEVLTVDQLVEIDEAVA